MKKVEADAMWDENKITEETAAFFSKRGLNDLVDGRIPYQNRGANLIMIDKERGKLAISETNFQKLKKLEESNGFAEKNIRNNQKFFFKGSDNDWNKILPKNIKEKIENNFYDEMLELEYLK